MCTLNAKSLEKFAHEVDKLDYASTPNYLKLRSILHELINKESKKL